ncbi:hypothetical protein [Agreia sp. VKM Ac-1783]|uniref:hypothetical protein n=1 Tax=Agreia sp. VKM Ac-1783 TaxID=1938889 RepID=UPI000A2AA480|nr:hypothetical protein [Agreia sp. VKM Ac-1783]SMQ74861.1 hypothetical protein SAMN06295943_3256 [Agreia sp. VKM Ac-1783]
MTRWRWRYAFWYLLLIPLIVPLSVVAGWVVKNSSRMADPPDYPLSANLFLGTVVIVPIVIFLFIYEARAARRFAAIRAQFPRAVVVEFGVSRELRAALQQLLGRRLAGPVLASMVVVVSETAIGLHRRADPTTPEIVLRWSSIGRVAVVRERRTIDVVVEILRSSTSESNAQSDSLIINLPVALNHSPSPRQYAGRREVLESALDGIASWREHRFVAGDARI